MAIDPTMIAGLASPAFQLGTGIGMAHRGKKMQKEAAVGLEEGRQAMEDTRYADYNQAYYDELQRRASVGLPQEQMLAMQQGADRAAGAALAASEDRRGGLMGIGRAQTSLSDAYRNIGLADVAERNRRAEAVLQEMSDRGVNTYTEQQGLNAYDLNRAEQMRQEGLAFQMAGVQNMTSGLSSLGSQISGMGGGGSMFGGVPQGAGGVAQQTAMVQNRAMASPTQGVNIAGQQQVTGLPANPYYNPLYGGGGF